MTTQDITQVDEEVGMTMEGILNSIQITIQVLTELDKVDVIKALLPTVLPLCAELMAVDGPTDEFIQVSVTVKL
jgi:hypothetical protein